VAATVLLEILKVNMAVKIVIGLVPVGFLVYQVILCFRYTLEQDELQRRIILEGLAISFAISLVIIFLVGFLIKAGVNIPFQFIYSGYILEIALVAGYLIAYRRYQ
jgi:hypothetical protein